MLGMRTEGRKKFPDKAPPYTSTFIFNITVNIPSEVVSQTEAISLGSKGLI
jgi:hypothetical protein